MKGTKGRSLLIAALATLLVASLLTACTFSVVGGVGGGIVSLILAAIFLLGTASTQTGCEIASTCLSVAYDGGDEPDADDDSDVGPCLGAPLDAFGDPDLVDFGACLSVAYDASDPDTDAEDEPDIGPCLSPPLDLGDDLDDAGDATDADDTGDAADAADAADSEAGDAEDDVEIGPCLSPPLDLGGTDGAEDGGDADPDAPDGDDARDGGDLFIGPCLSPPLDFGGWGQRDSDGDNDRATAALTGDESRDEVRARLSAEGILPPDVLARLRGQGPPSES